MNNKPLIFLTNDDGYQAPGLQVLIDCLKPCGRLVVVAPKTQMSGKSHAITAGVPLLCEQIEKQDDFELYALEGTPVDCVKMGFDNILKTRPDFLFAGVNLGSNTSINAMYSGTVAAVMEGCSESIPSIGFSLCNDTDPNASFSHTIVWIKQIIDKVIKNGLPKDTCLNVNIPDKIIDIKGIKVCYQAKGYWTETFDCKADNNGKTIHWLGGQYHCSDNRKDADWNAIQEGYIAITPLQVDFTAKEQIMNLRKTFNTDNQ